MKLKYIFLLMVLALATSLQAQKVRELQLKLRNQSEPVTFLVSDIDSITFSKSEALPKGPFSVSVSEISSVSALVNVVPDDDTMPYYFDLVTKADYDDIGGDLSVIMAEYVQFLKDIYGMGESEIASMLQSRGPDSYEFQSLLPDTEYYAFALGLADDCTVSTEATVIPFRTSMAGDPSQCTFDIRVGYVDARYAMIDIVPSDANVPYYYGVLPSDEYISDADVVAANQAELERVAEMLGSDLENIVKAMAMYGENQVEEDALQPATEYVAYVYAMGSDAGAAGNVYTVRFETKSDAVSDVKIEISCPKYFDGDALSELDPEKYLRYAGRVVVPAYVTVDDTNALHWYVGLSAGDVSDSAVYPDDSVISALVDNGGGVVDKKEITFVANWGTATFLGVAQDQNGIFGDVARMVMTFDKDGASPAEEFAAGQQSAAAPFRMKGAQSTPKHVYEMLREQKFGK